MNQVSGMADKKALLSFEMPTFFFSFLFMNQVSGMADKKAFLTFELLLCVFVVFFHHGSAVWYGRPRRHF